MQDWHEQTDEKRDVLCENSESHVFIALIDWLETMYEREKENIVMSVEGEVLKAHWVKANAVKELISDLTA